MARGLLVWLLIMAVETVHGVLRGVVLAPLMGTAAAERIGWPVAAVLVFGIALLTIRWTKLRGTMSWLRLGAAWAVLTILFELAIRALRGLDPQALMAALDPSQGTILWSAALMLATPLLAARLRGL